VTSLYGEPIRKLFGVGDGKDFVQFAFDFASLEAMIESHYCWRYDVSEDKEYCNSLIQEKPNDVHTKTANKIAEMIGQTFSRGNAKSVKYACAYGAQAPKVAKTVGCSVLIGERIFNAYWDAAAPLAALKDALTKYWETKGGKKFILGIDGRKIMTRSKHSLVNALFQGAGVTCAKRSMVYQDVEFRKRNISVDFWLEDWKNKPYIQQLIAYHDEAQFEMKHKLLTYKRFEDEVACKEWIASQEDEWLVLHTEKGWFAAYSEVFAICRESVVKTSKAYKLNVQLGIDPQLGLQWASCH
jgi:DNA polymerase I-like protein with 3'-5' exonuclease and polymerase domains